jgi:hypothetical protein
MAIVQGVGHVPPSDDRASTPGGFDWIRRAVVVGFGLNASKLLQAASPKPQITSAKARSSFMSAIPAQRKPQSRVVIAPTRKLSRNTGRRR